MRKLEHGKNYIMRKSMLFSHRILCRRQHEKKAEGLYEEEEEEEEDDQIK
jgi:hypothetical protein